MGGKVDPITGPFSLSIDKRRRIATKQALLCGDSYLDGYGLCRIVRSSSCFLVGLFS